MEDAGPGSGVAGRSKRRQIDAEIMGDGALGRKAARKRFVADRIRDREKQLPRAISRRWNRA